MLERHPSPLIKKAHLRNDRVPSKRRAPSSVFRNKNSPAGRRDLDRAEGEHNAVRLRRQAKLLPGEPSVHGFWGKWCAPARSIDQFRSLGQHLLTLGPIHSIARRFGVKAAISCHSLNHPALLPKLPPTAAESRSHDVKPHWACFAPLGAQSSGPNLEGVGLPRVLVRAEHGDRRPSP